MPSMMGMTKQDLRLFMLYEFKFEDNTFETPAIIEVQGKMSRQLNGQYECGSRNFVVMMRNFKLKKAEVGCVVLITNNCKLLLSKTHIKLSEKCLRFLVSAL